MDFSVTPQTINIHKRLREFDALRGVSMILVVFAHVLRGFNSTNCIVGEIFMSIRMPLFFFVSGFFAYRSIYVWDRRTYKRVFIQKIKAQIICTIIFFALFNLTHGDDPFDWIYKGFQGYWFTIVLFQMFCIYIVCTLIARMLKRDMAMCIMVVFTLVMIITIPMDVIQEDGVFEVLSTPSLCYYIQWFTLGLLARKFESSFTTMISNSCIKAVFIIGFVSCLCMLNLCNSIPRIIVSAISLINSYLGLLFFISIFYNAKDFFNRNNRISNGLCFVGRRTLDIYMLHYFLIPSIPSLGIWLMPNSMVLLQLVVGGSFAIVITIVCLLLSYCIRISPILADWLFGSKPKGNFGAQFVK